MRRSLFLVALWLLAAPPREAVSDVVTTTTGRVYEGKVVEERDDAVVIETTFEGRQEVPRASVKSVDRKVPPLREQLAFRVERATDAKGLLEVAAWAKQRGFRDELAGLYERVIALEPQNAVARKALGHVKVGKTWMTPEEKTAADAAAVEAEMRAKGFVLHEGKWVTPEEKAAREKGLVQDGAEWVTEEEWHRRRGETFVGGKWVRVGEEAGKARALALSEAIGTPLSALWAPHVDLVHELQPADAKAVLDAAEAGMVAAIGLLAPDPSEALRALRLQVVVFEKATPYARFVEVFDKEQRIKSIPGMEGWARAASRQKSFWWPEPVGTSGHYVFPNPVRNVQSAAVHNAALVCLTRHRFNYRFPSYWLQEGFAYHVELATLGFSDSYTVGRGGVEAGDAAAWQDSKRWKEAMKTAVGTGRVPTAGALAAATTPDPFGYVELVKAWSLVDLLVRLDAKRFKQFVDATKAKKGAEEEALEEAFGFGYGGLEDRWLRYVAAGFRT